MTASPPPAIPGDVTLIPAPQPRDAAAIATTICQALIDARAAAIPQPDYVHFHAGTNPTAGLLFTPATPQDAWDALRSWARYRNTTVTATEEPGRTGTYLARLTWHHDHIAFEAYAHISAGPGQEPGQ
jgi:hypothetical protein